MNLVKQLVSKICSEEIEYVGYYEWFPTEEDWVQLETDHKFLPTCVKEMKLNQYLLCYCLENNKKVLRAQYCLERNEANELYLRKFGHESLNYDFKALKLDRIADQELLLLQVQDETVRSSKHSRALKNNISVKDTRKLINARNDQQVCAIDLLKDPSKTIKLVTGTWGTGKTMLIVGAALEGLCQGRFNKIVWIRNNIDVEGTKDLGALPGDIWEKEKPFVGPFIDHVGEAQVKKMLLTGQLLVEPLQYLRGRSFDNAAILCSEAENLTKEHIQLIIARAGDNSEVFFDADCRQRDKTIFRDSQGVEKLIKRFTGKKLFGYVHLVKSERSQTAAMADLLND